MAGTVTVSEETFGSVKKIQWDWLSDASGDANKATTNPYEGEILFAVFEPDSGGTQPTDQYDVVINDPDGYDVLVGVGADLSNAANVYKLKAAMGAVKADVLNLVVSNGGNAKGGLVTLFIR